MGRKYAGILGPISFGTVIARSVIQGGDADSALMVACATLFAFAAIGYIVGTIAERTIVEAIQVKFHAKWQATDATDHTANNSQSTVSDEAA